VGPHLRYLVSAVAVVFAGLAALIALLVRGIPRQQTRRVVGGVLLALAVLAERFLALFAPIMFGNVGDL
jgi:predicted benzoate:H+ symporter BenE